MDPKKVEDQCIAIQKKKVCFNGKYFVVVERHLKYYKFIEQTVNSNVYKLLFDSYLSEDANLDEATEGWDIGYHDSRSHFASLLDEDNDMLLNDFVNDCENVEVMVNSIKRKPWRNNRARNTNVDNDSCESDLDDFNDPDEAFLSISQNLRQAFKKHLPLVRTRDIKIH